MRHLIYLSMTAILTGCALTSAERTAACRTAPAGDACVEGRATPTQRRELQQLALQSSVKNDASTPDSGPASDAASTDPCQRSILAFMYERAPIAPDSKCAYRVYQVKTMQKVDGGYLVQGLIFHEGSTPAMLYTDAALERDQLAGSEETRARYTGSYRYEGLDGFEHVVPAFKVVSP